MTKRLIIRGISCRLLSPETISCHVPKDATRKTSQPARARSEVCKLGGGLGGCRGHFLMGFVDLSQAVQHLYPRKVLETSQLTLEGAGGGLELLRLGNEAFSWDKRWVSRNTFSQRQSSVLIKVRCISQPIGWQPHQLGIKIPFGLTLQKFNPFKELINSLADKINWSYNHGQK